MNERPYIYPVSVYHSVYHLWSNDGCSIPFRIPFMVKQWYEITWLICLDISLIPVPSSVFIITCYPMILPWLPASSHEIDTLGPVTGCSIEGCATHTATHTRCDPHPLSLPQSKRWHHQSDSQLKMKFQSISGINLGKKLAQRSQEHN